MNTTLLEYLEEYETLIASHIGKLEGDIEECDRQSFGEDARPLYRQEALDALLQVTDVYHTVVNMIEEERGAIADVQQRN